MDLFNLVRIWEIRPLCTHRNPLGRIEALTKEPQLPGATSAVLFSFLAESMPSTEVFHLIHKTEQATRTYLPLTWRGFQVTVGDYRPGP